MNSEKRSVFEIEKKYPQTMATATESSEGEKPPSNIVVNSKTLEQATPWIEYAVQQAMIYQKIAEESMNSAFQASRSRLSEIRLTASAHFHRTIDSLHDVKLEFAAYEDMLFGKVKEGIDVAASHPFITSGVAFGLGSLVLKRPRRFLYYNTLRLLLSEESLISRADARVKEMRQSIDRLKAESEKMERVASLAEDELLRGRIKLRQAGKQIQGAIHSAYKIERQAAGLQDILGELPRRDASRFRSQVSKLASEAKRERNALSKEFSKISNHGICV